MTTVERTTPGPTTTFTTTPRMTRHGRDTQASAARGWRTWALQGFALAAVALGTQTLAASSPIRSDVRMILPSEGLLAGLGDGLRRGYGLAMEQAAACGVKPPSLQLGWLPPGADPLKPVTAAPRSSLLVAPPAAPVQAYGLLADQQHLSVLLPLQRGRSLEALPQLRGSDRLWPLVPGRSLEADRLAQALLDDNIRRVMVVRDLSAESKALSDRFVASFANGNGQVIGAAPEPIAMGMNDPTAIKQLVSDVDWYRPPALVVITQPDSPLARAVRQGDWPETLLIAWPFPVSQRLPLPQIGVDPLSRGPGWTGFAAQFARRWGYGPGLVESAGYDTGQLAALASVGAAGKPGWDLHWFSSNARPLPLCTALKLRAQGARVRPQAATSRFDLSPGVPPTAKLRLSRG